MDPNQRQTLQINTFYYMMIVLSILSVTHIAMTMTIIFGDLAGKELVVAGTIVAITLIGSFGLIRLTKNFKLLLLEMDDKLAKTNFGKDKKRKTEIRVFAGVDAKKVVVKNMVWYSVPSELSSQT